jgi:hypothetical protein
MLMFTAQSLLKRAEVEHLAEALKSRTPRNFQAIAIVHVKAVTGIVLTFLIHMLSDVQFELNGD